VWHAAAAAAVLQALEQWRSKRPSDSRLNNALFTVTSCDKQQQLHMHS
jgi:hypothetical protein